MTPQIAVTHLDLFSGIGGFAIAAQAAGFTTIGFSEIEPYACKILKRHWPDVPNYGDVRNVPKLRADLITGGPPCQPASCAGKRRGKEDDRWLWPQTLACVERIKPTLCLFENPTGILSLNGGVEFEGVLSGLEGFGYAVQPIIIPAVGVDARHRRDRVWIIAYSASSLLSTKQERERDMLGRGQDSVAHGEKRFMARQTVADADCDERHGRKRIVQMGRRRCESEIEDDGFARGTEWGAEPSVGRVAHGIPNRSHRLRGLGNAIVPQVAIAIMKAMLRAL